MEPMKQKNLYVLYILQLFLVYIYMYSLQLFIQSIPCYDKTRESQLIIIIYKCRMQNLFRNFKFILMIL